MKKCKVCDRPHHANGYCSKHARQISRYGKLFERTTKDPNEFVIKGDICEMVLFDINYAPKATTQFNVKHLERVKLYKWHLSKNGYVNGKHKGVRTTLHRLILSADRGMLVDHINHDKLNNLDLNLRFATKQQNARNRINVKGVWFNEKTKKWIASICINYKNIHLGSFVFEDDAIKVRKEAVIKYFGEYAYRN